MSNLICNIFIKLGLYNIYLNLYRVAKNLHFFISCVFFTVFNIIRKFVVLACITQYICILNWRKVYSTLRVHMCRREYQG
jgi:hypothetical protein